MFEETSRVKAIRYSIKTVLDIGLRLRKFCFYSQLSIERVASLTMKASSRLPNKRERQFLREDLFRFWTCVTNCNKQSYKKNNNDLDVPLINKLPLQQKFLLLGFSLNCFSYWTPKSLNWRFRSFSAPETYAKSFLMGEWKKEYFWHGLCATGRRKTMHQKGNSQRKTFFRHERIEWAKSFV